MSLIELKVNRISYSQSQNGAYALILEENDGERKPNCYWYFESICKMH